MSDDATSPLVVGQQLARRRDDLDLTQDGLAQRIGVSARTISAIERGVNSIQRGNRATWESALRLKAGTISRAYRDGSPIESDATDPGVPADEPDPTVAELAERLERLEREAERDRQENSELRRLLREITGKGSGISGSLDDKPDEDNPRQAM